MQSVGALDSVDRRRDDRRARFVLLVHVRAFPMSFTEERIKIADADGIVHYEASAWHRECAPYNHMMLHEVHMANDRQVTCLWCLARTRRM